MTGKYSVFFQDTEIAFTLKRTDRRSIAVKVYPDCRVEVVAPLFSTRRFILKTVNSKAAWIIKKQAEFSLRQPLPPAPGYKTGEVFKLTGNPLVLKVSEGKQEIRTENGCIIMTAAAGSTAEKRKKLLTEWYRQEGTIIFSERMTECIRRTAVIGITESPCWKSKKMKRRWGSCTAENRIYLNIELAAAPVELIDYVILHELCHLIEHNHSPRYYSLLSAVCPNWKSLRKRLNDEVQIRLA